MLKFIYKHISIDMLKLSSILALIYMLLFNSSVLIYKFDYYSAGGLRAVFELGKEFIYIYCTLLIFFFGFTVNITLFYIATLILFITASIASYYLYFFQILPTPEVIESLFATNFEEAFEIISTKLLIWIIFCVTICIYTIKYFEIKDNKLFVSKLLSFVCLLLTINCIISPPYKVLSSYFPVKYLHNTYKHLTYSNKNKTRSDISQNYIFTDSGPNSSITGVLVIGESARYDHFGINGYHRNTTPLLEHINNLVSFQATACSNSTYISVPCLLSRIQEEQMGELDILSETGLLSVLTRMGYDTSWIGTQSLMKYLTNKNLGTLYDEVKFAIIPGGSALYRMNDIDEIMLPYIQHMLEKRVDKQFLVIHTSGSHWNYASRYPSNFSHFLPCCNASGKTDQTSCDKDSLINSYDNSILYTDFFLSNVIKLLQDKNAFMIYVSDHAESLGEHGRYGHGGDFFLEQRNIPFMIWTSDKFNQNFPEMKSAINTHINNKLSHDYVFHSILDCLGIESEIIEDKFSLCKKNSFVK